MTPQAKTMTPIKNVRHRKKNHFNAIRRQMEFYFGDANLSKDRFLRKLIETDVYVPFETFMSFNKMKTLVTCAQDIAKALGNSELLEVNKEGTGVRRRTAIPEVHEADDRTIYVESLPQDADHDWVIKAFNRFGTVAYVSLPKYKDSKKIKEFAFVEFADSRAVEKALHAFRMFNGTLCYETTPPDQLTSVRSYLKEQKKMKANDGTNVKKQHTGETDSDSSDSVQPAAKRIKLCDIETDTSESESHAKSVKKRRKHRKKAKLVADLEMDGGPNITELKITTKKEWKRLRNKYLNVQREKMSELKRHMLTNREPKAARLAAPRLPIHHSPHMNFYQDRNKGADKENDPKPITPDPAGDSAEHEAPSFPSGKPSTSAEQPAPLHYESGLIVHVHILEPCVDVKELKTELRQYNQVKYVDVKEGATEVHLRCDSATGAQTLVKQISCAEYTCEILSGPREESYWNKIMQDRTDKLTKKMRVRSRRGREKIKQQLPSHIRFDDDPSDDQ